MTEHHLKFAVVGVGGLGGFFGGRLAAAGHDVTFVARGAHLDVLRRDGLTVRGPDTDLHVERVRAVGDSQDVGEADVVLLCVKMAQLDEALERLKPVIGPGTAVVTVQNGVDAPQQVADALGRDAVLPGIARVNTYLEAPGVVRHVGGLGALAFAEWDNRPSDRVRQLRAVLGAAGVKSPAPDDVWADLWAKFLFVAPCGGLGAVTGEPFGVLRSRPGTRAVLRDAMTEVQAVAGARGVALPDDIVATSLDFLDRQPAEGTPSLHRDILAGRPNELEAWTGAVVRLGAATGTPTPVNSLLYELAALRADRAAN
ncbi:2-dehydropantoate 2-reductase [Streptomyces sp. DG1A-41]|uniref:2-dehydropantoate 2-reductase n=1 Tax=Streptomyces sp. DG1A-41 TaxID=3125779 RepID=UPI0030CE2CCD